MLSELSLLQFGALLRLCWLLRQSEPLSVWGPRNFVDFFFHQGYCEKPESVKLCQEGRASTSDGLVTSHRAAVWVARGQKVRELT